MEVGACCCMSQSEEAGSRSSRSERAQEEHGWVCAGLCGLISSACSRPVRSGSASPLRCHGSRQGPPMSAACCHCSFVSFDAVVHSLLRGSSHHEPWFSLPFYGNPSSSSFCGFSPSLPPVNSVGTQSSILAPLPSLGDPVQSWASQEMHMSTTRVFTPLDYNLLQTPELNLSMDMVSPLRCPMGRQNSFGFTWFIGKPHLHSLQNSSPRSRPQCMTLTLK